MSVRDLMSTCYDGTKIRTPWPASEHFVGPAQRRHADVHRDRVRTYLIDNRLTVLLNWRAA